MKKIRPEVAKDIPAAGGFIELMDMFFLPLFNVTIAEMEFISGQLTPEEMNQMMSLETFPERRKALKIRNKYLSIYYSH